MEKRVVYSQIEILENGVLQVRLDKQIVDNGQVIWSQPHRTIVEPGINAEAQMAEVTRHLTEQMGYPAVPVDVVERVRRVAAVEHTPDVITRFRERQPESVIERGKRIA